MIELMITCDRCDRAIEGREKWKYGLTVIRMIEALEKKCGFDDGGKEGFQHLCDLCIEARKEEFAEKEAGSHVR
jgi:hypothetical protein